MSSILRRVFREELLPSSRYASVDETAAVCVSTKFICRVCAEALLCPPLDTCISLYCHTLSERTGKRKIVHSRINTALSIVIIIGARPLGVPILCLPLFTSSSQVRALTRKLQSSSSSSTTGSFVEHLFFAGVRDIRDGDSLLLGTLLSELVSTRNLRSVSFAGFTALCDLTLLLPSSSSAPRLPYLTELDISETSISDGALASALCECPNLRELDISDPSLVGGRRRALGKSVWPLMLADDGRGSTLNTFIGTALGRTAADAPNFDGLFALQSLTEVDLSFNWWRLASTEEEEEDHDHDPRAVAKRMFNASTSPRLIKLDLSFPSQTDTGLIHDAVDPFFSSFFSFAPSLVQLKLCGWQLTSIDWQLPNLCLLDVSNCSQLSSNPSTTTTTFPRLQHLNVSNTQFSDFSQLATLSPCLRVLEASSLHVQDEQRINMHFLLPFLECLDIQGQLSWASFGAGDFEKLAVLPKLRELNIKGCGVRDRKRTIPATLLSAICSVVRGAPSLVVLGADDVVQDQLGRDALSHIHFL